MLNNCFWFTNHLFIIILHFRRTVGICILLFFQSGGQIKTNAHRINSINLSPLDLKMSRRACFKTSTLFFVKWYTWNCICANFTWIWQGWNLHILYLAACCITLSLLEYDNNRAGGRSENIKGNIVILGLLREKKYFFFGQILGWRGVDWHLDPPFLTVLKEGCLPTQ